MNFISNWKDKITQAVENKITAVKLGFISKASGILGYFIFILLAIFLALAILIFLGIGLGEVLADAFDSRAGGFFAIAGVYAILIGLLVAFRTSIVDGFASIFIKMLTLQDDDDDDDDEKNNKD